MIDRVYLGAAAAVLLAAAVGFGITTLVYYLASFLSGQ